VKCAQIVALKKILATSKLKQFGINRPSAIYRSIKNCCNNFEHTLHRGECQKIFYSESTHKLLLRINS